MKFFDNEVSRVVKVGSVCFTTLKVVLIVVLSSIDKIMLANPIVMKMMMPRESRPPVKVLYSP